MDRRRTPTGALRLDVLQECSSPPGARYHRITHRTASCTRGPCIHRSAPRSNLSELPVPKRPNLRSSPEGFHRDSGQKLRSMGWSPGIGTQRSAPRRLPTCARLLTSRYTNSLIGQVSQYHDQLRHGWAHGSFPLGQGLVVPCIAGPCETPPPTEASRAAEQTREDRKVTTFQQMASTQPCGMIPWNDRKVFSV